MAELVSTVPRAVRQGADWVFYGSHVTGSARPGSDIDILVLHHSDEAPPHRVGTRIDDTPVTIYVLPWSALQADAEQQAYGGYFCLKLFGPFVPAKPGPEPQLMRAVARFLAPLAADTARRRGLRQRTRHQVLADSYLAFLNLYPDFDSYAARALRSPILASPTWQRQAHVVVDAYHDAGLLTATSLGRYTYAVPSAADIEDRRMLAAARFWAFGAVCHDADPAFPDTYRAKARKAVSAARRRAVREELRRLSNGWPDR